MYVRRKRPLSPVHVASETVSQSHDVSHGVSHDSPHSVEVILDSQSECEDENEVVEVGNSDPVVAPQTGQTSLKDQKTLGQTGLAGNNPTRTSEVSPKTDDTLSSEPTTTSGHQQTISETCQTGLTGCRSEGMDVEGATSSGDGATRGEDGDKVWLKFNDVSVSEVTWSEVQRESVGDCQSNTSAYCLVYLNEMLHEQWLRNGKKNHYNLHIMCTQKYSTHCKGLQIDLLYCTCCVSLCLIRIVFCRNAIQN